MREKGQLMASQQALSQPTIDINDEWIDLRKTALAGMSLLYIVTGAIIWGLTFNANGIIRLQTNPVFSLLLIVLIATGLAIFHSRKQYPQFATTLSIITVWIGLTIFQVFVEYQPSLMYLTIFPVLLGFVFLDGKQVPMMSAVALVIVLLIDYVVFQTLRLTVDTFIIAILLFGCAFTGYALINNLRQTMAWAIDSQTKNYVRAESFYNQGEELRQTVLDLNHSNHQLRHLTEQLNRAKQEVEEISQAKSSFLSNMSHELRTPLNMVIGYTSSILNMPQMYNNHELPEVFRPDIELVLSSGQYLLTLINDILDLSKIESGKFEINPTAFDLEPVLQGVMATALGLVKDKPLQLKPDYPDDIPLLWGDPIRVRQILLNLMSNAVKYTESGSVTLFVTLQGNRVRIGVSDTGVGIPENTIATIFDRFEQVQNNTNIQGTGLGLDISQRLAHMHDSEITIESEIGFGSTFAFDLALATDEQIVAFDTEATHHDLGGIKRFEDSTPSWETKHTVLIAEDDSDTRGLLMRLFESNDYVVFGEQDGDNVYEMASALLPHLIILDIVLPNKNGLDILSDLRNDPETVDIPVIVLSANLEDQEVESDAITQYLSKPVQPDEILECSQFMLDQRQTTPMEI